MDAKEIIARRVALELHDRTLVNLGIGLPTLVASYVPPGIRVAFQSENGIVGFGARPPEGMEDPYLTDAGGGFVSALPGAWSFDSVTSFALIRGGHLDMTVLGGLQVDAGGRLANWMVPGRMVAGMGGAMDLVAGARRVVIAMQHTARGEPKIVRELTLPATAVRRVTLVVTDMAVIEPTDDGLVLRERAPGVTVEAILAATGAPLRVEGRVPEMRLGAAIALRRAADGEGHTHGSGPDFLADAATADGARSRHQHDHADRAIGGPAAGRLAAARCRTRPATLRHRDPLRSDPGGRDLAAAPAACAAGCRRACRDVAVARRVLWRSACQCLPSRHD